MRLVGSSTIVDELVAVEMMLPANELKFTSVLLYEKLELASQWFASRFRAVTSRPLNVRLKPGTFVSVTTVGIWKFGT